MPLWINPVLALLLAYLLGSLPFGLILTRAFGVGDLRSIGSGNIGATNVLRTGNKGLAAATLLLDLAKGAVAVWLARAIDPELALIGGVGAFFGHLFPLWLRFKGGKGVATMLGIALAIGWQIGLVFALVWLAALALVRISAVSGMAAALAAPVTAFYLGDAAAGVMLLALAIMVVWKHQANLARLVAGTEPRVGQKPA